MSHANLNDEDEPRRDDALQFDEAEYGPASESESEGSGKSDVAAPAESEQGVTCGICASPIDTAYYEINRRVVCEACRGKIEASMKGGSRVRRVVRAFVFGALAAVAGFAIYYGVLALTKYQFGLISILVGFMVGGAVRKGADHRGGWFYQLMAMFLTYSVIVATFSVALLNEGLRQDANQAADADPAPNPKPAAIDPAAAPPDGKEFGKVLIHLMWVTAMLVGLLYALPVMIGKEDPISALIMAFALWEAWKLNKRVHLVFNGPYRVGDRDGDDGGDPTATGVTYA